MPFSSLHKSAAGFERAAFPAWGPAGSPQPARCSLPPAGGGSVGSRPVSTLRDCGRRFGFTGRGRTSLPGSLGALALLLLFCILMLKV